MIVLSRSPEAKTRELAGLQRDAILRVNLGIEAVRKLFITPIVGQELIYTEKESEARRFMSMDPPPEDLTEFPFIAAEIGATAPSAYEVAQLYLNLGAQWRIIGSQLEQLRLGTIAQIEQAEHPDQVDGAMQMFDLTLGAFT